MPPAYELTAPEQLLLDELLAEYDAEVHRVETFEGMILAAITGSQELMDRVHSLRSRIKERDHLEDKLKRKFKQCNEEGVAFEIAPGDLLTKVNDLVGVRILHLYTRQIRDIDAALRQIFVDQSYELLEAAARTWDDESREFFASCGIDTQRSETLYTSVHYVIGSASRVKVTCEIQVRTLMEEVWGEVDHEINYPVASDAFAVREQLKVLARVTSSATRLVDAIFLTHADAALPTPEVVDAGPDTETGNSEPS